MIPPRFAEMQCELAYSSGAGTDLLAMGDQFDAAMDQLAALDARDIAATLNTETCRAFVSFLAPVPGGEDEMAFGWGMLRTALHAAGCSTRDWPTKKMQVMDQAAELTDA